MTYTIQCQCGKETEVSASKAGCEIECECGGWLTVPSFHQLSKSNDVIRAEPATVPEKVVLAVNAKRLEVDDIPEPAPKPKLFSFGPFLGRFTAFLLDVVPITFCVFVAFYFLFGFDETFHRYSWSGWAHHDKFAEGDLLKERNQIRNVATILFLVVTAGFQFSFCRASIGKMIVGLEILQSDGQKLGIGRSLIRSLLSVALFPGLFFTIWTKNREAWHDRLTKTKVEAAKGQSWYLRLLLFVAYFVVLPVACVSICVTLRYRQNSIQNLAVDEIRRMGGDVFYSYDNTAFEPRKIDLRQEDGTRWIRSRLGEDFYDQVDVVVFQVLSEKTLSDNGYNFPKDFLEKDELRRANIKYLFKDLTRFRRLSKLMISGNRVADDDLRILPRIRKLRQLGIGQSNITDESLRIIANCPDLEHLNVSGCKRITDKGFRHLARAKNLKFLIVSGTNVTPESVDWLKEQIPGLNVWDNRSFADLMRKD